MTVLSHVAVIGAGTVGRHLARAVATTGRQVTFGLRDPDGRSAARAREAVGSVAVTSIATAVRDADAAVLAVPYPALQSVLAQINEAGDTILIDVTNAMGESLPAPARSVPDVIAGLRPDLPVVKAFNTIGAEAYVAPSIDGRPLFLPVAGPQPAADAVAALVTDIGFDAVVIGDRDQAAHLEAMARLWVHLAFRTGFGRDFGFARLMRP